MRSGTGSRPNERPRSTGVRYQLAHALGLFVVVFLRTIGPDCLAETVAGVLFVVGTVLFSGSLYVLAMTGDRRWGIATPFGGLCFLAGWLAWSGRRQRSRSASPERAALARPIPTSCASLPWPSAHRR
jgi:uncharacterized membrane protein YgdD (TMEM256/DUF423 family)